MSEKNGAMSEGVNYLPVISVSGFKDKNKDNKEETLKMEKDWKRVEPIFDGFFEDNGWITTFDDYQEKDFNLTSESEISGKLYRNFYFQKIDAFIKRKLDKTEGLIRELTLINEELPSSGKDINVNVEKDFSNLPDGYTENTFPKSYQNLVNKIVNLQKNNKGESWNGFRDDREVGLGSPLIKEGSDLSPIEKGDSYVIKVLNKEKIFTYLKDINLTDKVISELNKSYNLDTNKVFDILSIDEKEIRNLVVDSIINGEDKEKARDLFTNGSEALSEVKKVKEHDLIGVEISRDLAELLEKLGVKKVENAGALFKTILENQEKKYEDQKEKENNFKLSINLRLDSELSKYELDRMVKSEYMKIIDNKLSIIERLNEAEETIMGEIRSKDSKKTINIHYKVVNENLEVKIIVMQQESDKDETRKLKADSVIRTGKVQKIIDTLKFTKKERNFFDSNGNKDLLFFDEAISQVIANRRDENKITKDEVEIMKRIDKLQEKLIPGIKKQRDDSRLTKYL